MEKHTLNTPTGVFTLPGRPPQMAKHYEVVVFLQNHLTSFHQDFETTSMAPFYLTLALQTIMQLARGGGK